jgi:hypothetical protein
LVINNQGIPHTDYVNIGLIKWTDILRNKNQRMVKANTTLNLEK